MSPSLTLGRIAGIRIGVHWSWLLVFGLMVWTLSESVFPRQNPGLTGGEYRGMALVAAALLFVSVLLHELGHALQARREGVAIDGIVLWLFGGVASFRGAFPGPGPEFRITVAGPLVSLALGLAFAGFAGLQDLPVTVDGVTFWLAYINLALLVFNLLPALPLDGGRILRSALWRLRGDIAWATRIAAEAGRATGLLLVAGGVVMLLLGGGFGGVWLAFIGWFVLSAAGGEAEAAEARQAIAGLCVRDLMVRDPRTADSDETIAQFLAGLESEGRLTAYPVVEDDRLVGLIPTRTALETPPRDRSLVRVGERMLGLEGAPRLAPDDDLFAALSRLAEAGVNRGLVLEGDRLVGHLSVEDVAQVSARRR